MANDTEMKIVISAEDEYSGALDNAAKKAEEAAARVVNSFERNGAVTAAAGLDVYVASVERASAAEIERERRLAENAAALKAQAANQPDVPAQTNEQLAADEESRYQARLGAMAVYNDAVLREVETARAAQNAIEVKYTAEEISLALKKRDLQIAYTGDAFGAASDAMLNLYNMTGKKNREMFQVMKAFAIAETIISTYSAAQKSFDKGITETGSYWGGIAYAAAATIAGMARVAEIENQKPGGGTGGSGSGGAAASAAPSYQNSSSSAYTAPSQDSSKAPQQVTVNVYNPLSDQNWQKIVEENIVPAINDAAERNIVVTVKNMG